MILTKEQVWSFWNWLQPWKILYSYSILYEDRDFRLGVIDRRDAELRQLKLDLLKPQSRASELHALLQVEKSKTARLQHVLEVVDVSLNDLKAKILLLSQKEIGHDRTGH